MTRSEWKLGKLEIALNNVKVGMADAAGVYLQHDTMWLRLRCGDVPEFERAGVCRFRRCES